MLIHSYYAERAHEEYELRVAQFLLDQSLRNVGAANKQTVFDAFVNRMRPLLETIKENRMSYHMPQKQPMPKTGQCR